MAETPEAPPSSAGFSLQPDFEPVARSEWRERVERDLRGAPFEKRLVTKTYEGIELQPLYTAEAVEADQAGLPGFAPFTRGSTPIAGVTDGWDRRQVVRLSHPAAANAALLDDLAKGASSLRLDVDRSGGETGGVRIDGLPSLERTLRDVGFDDGGPTIAISTSHDGLPVAAALLAHLESAGADRSRVRAWLGLDPLASLARLGHLDTPAELTLDYLSDAAAYCAEQWPGVRAVTVDTSVYHDAGASSAQDLALAVTTGIAYLRAMERAGLSPDRAAAQVAFRLRLGCRFFMGIAKVRAARRLWGRVLEACGVDEAQRGMVLEVGTANRVMTARDPWVNLLRNTVVCFAGAVAGAEAITLEPLDAAIGEPIELARRLARNTQIVLRDESSLARVIDPAGGSWLVESLTDELAERAWGLVQKIEQRGGVAAALLGGFVAEQLASTAAERARRVATRRDPVTGVSEFPLLDAAPPAGLELGAGEPGGDEELPPTPGPGRTAHIEAVSEAAAALAAGNAPSGALMRALVGAAESCAIAELRALLSHATGGSRIEPLPAHRNAAAYEALRDASDAVLESSGQRPEVFLANLGPISEHNARAGFARNLLEAGGLRAVTVPDGVVLEEPDEVRQAFGASGAKLAAICSSDRRYALQALDVAKALADAGARAIVLAGRPGDEEPSYRAAGVTHFMYLGCNVLELLGGLWDVVTETGEGGDR